MGRPHTDIRKVVSDVPPLHTLSVTEARMGYEQFLAVEENVATVAEVRDTAIPGPNGDIPLRIYTPEGEGPFPTLVWFHGGGFLLGSVESYDPVCRVLAEQLDCVVVSVDYRLAPEHKFPKGVQDCYTAVEWASARRTELGGSDHLVVGGDSAGGNLAAVVSLMARDKNGPDIDYQVLVYPTTNFELDYATEGGNEEYFITEPDLAWSWNHYLPDEINGFHPYASPLRARDLSGLPPATVLTATFDPLHDEGIEYAERLVDAGVSVRHENYDDMIHSFFTNVASPRVERAWDAIAKIDDDLQESLHRKRLVVA